MVETLDGRQRQAIVEVLVPAFASHPAFAPGTSPDVVRAVLDLLVHRFGRVSLHGIRRQGGLACVAVSLDRRVGPHGWELLKFFYRFWRLMGTARLLDLVRDAVGRPRYAKPYLELFLLGTTPTSQKRGLGREMLAFLYALAREQGFAGLVLTAARRSPACGFYIREGFVIDSEVWFRGEPLVNMRRDNRPA